MVQISAEECRDIDKDQVQPLLQDSGTLVDRPNPIQPSPCVKPMLYVKIYEYASELAEMIEPN
jgi:hypothetical protein